MEKIEKVREMKNESTENESTFGRIKRVFSLREREVAKEEERYQPRLLDSRIEKYLDRHFDEYIKDYGLVTKQRLTAYDKKANDLEESLSSLVAYTRDADAAVTDLERRMTEVEKVAPKPMSQMSPKKQGK